MKSISLQAYLFLIAVPLHLAWEVAQIRAYDFPKTTLMEDILGCFVPSLGDGLMTLMIYWAGWLIFRNPKWILNPSLKGYLLMMSVGFILAVLVEWNALYRTVAWSYDRDMIIIPILGVGLLPVLQMTLLPPATAFLLQRTWKDRNAR